MRNLIRSLAISLLLLWPSSGMAEVGVWTKVFTGNVYAVDSFRGPTAGGNPAALWIGTQTGIFKSDDLINWTQVSPLPTLSLSVSPTPGVVFAATQSGLIKTIDNGVTWTSVNPAIRGWVLVHPANPQIVFGDNFRSLNGGQNWTVMTGLPLFSFFFGSELDHLKATAADPNRLLAMVGNQAYESLDGGATWHIAPFVIGKLDSVELDPASPGYGYVGACTAGNSLRYFPGGFQNFIIGGHVHALVVDPAYPERVYGVNDSCQVYSSTNRGAIWQPYPAPPMGTVPEGRMFFCGKSGRIFLPMANNGLYMIDTWQPATCTDLDGDGYRLEGGSCGPVDCNDADPAIRPGAAELCTDGIDNDCDQLTDAADPDAVNCPLACTDADLDGVSREGGDCGPSDCNDADPAIRPGAVELCTDGIDNDCDQLTDAADPDAVNCPLVCTDADLDGVSREGGDCGPSDCNDADPAIRPGAVELCTDGIDNDCDQLTDAADPDAVNCPPACTDADQDGFSPDGGACGPLDCNDSDSAVRPGAVELCTDGIDNDCDQLTDYADPGCPLQPEICSDGLDNDGDGKIDCADRDCRTNAACQAPPPTSEICSDGLDNDGDGKIDCADRDCRRDPACP